MHYCTRLPDGRRDPTYVVWASMKQRCSNPKTINFRDYGGRGITVCQRWRESFENFFADMGVRPAGMQLDRYPNKDGNYEPGNCRWITPKANARNRRNNRLLTYRGETRPMAEWAELNPCGTASSPSLRQSRLCQARPSICRHSTRQHGRHAFKRSLALWAKESERRAQSECDSYRCASPGDAG